MASRQNKEARVEVPSYGAPMGPPVVSTEEKIRRERERQTRLETKPTAEEQTRRIAEDEERGIEETAKKRRDRLTATPKPKPAYTRIGETTGKPPTQIIAERPEDIGRAVDIAEGVEPAPRAAPAVETEPVMPIRERKPPKRK